MNKRTLVLMAALLVAVLVANAAVFTYRSMTGTITVSGADQAEGAACTGFYSSAEQSGIAPTYLPEAGTNYNADTYGDNQISVTTGDVVCQWTDTNTGNTYSLYDSIAVSIPITVGSWYIKDFYGFGYNGTSNDPNVYVTFIVEQNVDPTVVGQAILYIYDDSTNSIVASLDLTSQGDMVGPLQMAPGSAYQFDLKIIDANEGTVSFSVVAYVSQSSESPTR